MMMMMPFSENTPHASKSLEWFQQMRPEVSGLVETIIQAVQNGKRNICIKAEVKSGKKDIVECLSRRVERQHLTYATALNRKDVKKQKEELEIFGITTRCINGADECDAAIGDIAMRVQSGIVWICFDECDYGSGDNQKMAPLFKEFIDTQNAIKVYFSATLQEAEASSMNQRGDYIMLTFVPPPTYHGAKYFLDEELVFEPESFFVVDKETGDIGITAHAETVIQESITEQRHIGAVRIVSGIKISEFKKTAIKRDLEARLNLIVSNGRPWNIVPVDASSSHDWEDRITRRGYVSDTEVNHLFIINQTCTRGTDLKGWHSTLAFWHDNRKHDSNSRPNTLIQAFLRPSHYGDAQAIRLYVSEIVVKLAADDDIAFYLNHKGKTPSRTKVGTSGTKGGISAESFATVDEAKAWWLLNCNNPRNASLFHHGEGNTFQYRALPRKIVSEEETRSSTDLWWGVKGLRGRARVMPVFANDNPLLVIRYIVLFEKTNAGGHICPLKTTQKSMYDGAA